MTINALILAILIIGLIIKGDKRNLVLIFIGPALLFQLGRLIGIIPSDYFHLIACYLDVAVIAMLVKWSRPGFVSVFLALISAGSIFANAGGWMAYEKGLQPLVYDGVYVAVYSLVLVVSLMEWSSVARADCHDMRIRSGWI
jgi:hypothetical protein